MANDTVELLRECDAGVRMGMESLEEMLPHVQDSELKDRITACKDTHVQLKQDISEQLAVCGATGEAPNAMARGMSWMKTQAMTAMKPGDSTVAELVIDGCDMGAKSLSKYLNRYKGADERAKETARQLISAESKMSIDMRGWL